MKKSSAHSRTKSAQRVTNSSPRRLPIFSLDVGYGYTKIMDPSGAQHIFPSLVAPGDIGSIDLGIASAACPAVFLDGVEYIVGENAATGNSDSSNNMTAGGHRSDSGQSSNTPRSLSPPKPMS
jgi:hypothetical protein